MYNTCIIIKGTQRHTNAVTQSIFSFLYQINQNSASTLLSTTLTEIPSLRRRFLARVWTSRSLSSMFVSVTSHFGHPCKSSNSRTTWLCVRGLSSALLFNAMLLRRPMRVVEKCDKYSILLLHLSYIISKLFLGWGKSVQSTFYNYIWYRVQTV